MMDPLTPAERKSADDEAARIARPYVLAEMVAVLLIVCVLVLTACGAFR